MPISNSQYLFRLVKSLTKADKRNFKLYAKRVQSDDNMKFIQLFDIVDKMPELDETKILEKMGNIDKGQLSNLKRHLYKQLLTSLRLININRINSIEVREHIDFAHVLYTKGLFQQSLKILQRAKRMAENVELEMEVLQVIEFQKLIESRHITNTGPVKNDALVDESRDHLKKIHASVSLSNLRVRLHGYYIRNSHVKNEEERLKAVQFLEENLPQIDINELGHIEKIYLYQSFVWHYYILLEFEKCYEYALNWVKVFDDNPELKLVDTDLYMRGFHYLLTATYNLQDLNNLAEHYNVLQHFRKSNYSKFNENSKIFSFMYTHWARLNIHFLKGTFEEGVKDIPSTLKRIKRWKDTIAPHRIMVFYYKIAWMYLGNNQPDKAVNYINKIINSDSTAFREDIQTYSRLVYLMGHYDLDNIDLLPYLVNTVESFYKKIRSKNRLQTRTLQFFKKVSTVGISERAKLLEEFNTDLRAIYLDPFEKRAFLYLDILNWVESKITKKSMGELKQASLK